MRIVVLSAFAVVSFTLSHVASAGPPGFCKGGHYDEAGNLVCGVLDGLSVSSFGQRNFFRGAEPDQVLPKFDEFMSALGVGPTCEGPSADALASWLSAEVARVETHLEQTEETDDNEDQLEQLEDYLRTMKGALAQFDGVDASHVVQRTEACRRAKATVYSQLADMAVEAGDGPSMSLPNLFRLGFRTIPWIGRAVVNTVSYQSPSDTATSHEAGNLVDPANPARFVTTEELSQMTVREVALLQVSPYHWMVHPTARKDLFQEVESRVAAEMTEALGAPYDVRQATELLIFRKIKDSATSPKLDVTGVAPRGDDGRVEKMKLKFGEEAMVEPVTACLWGLWGGKDMDLNYHQAGGGTQWLVLASQEDRDDADADECIPVTRAQFEQCMRDSDYDFESSHHIESATAITAGNYQALIGDRLPDWADDKFDADFFIGRTVLTFKESGVEAQHRAGRNRIGPAPLHNAEAQNDRALRASFAYALWVRASDDKEDNNRVECLDAAGQPDPLCLGKFHDIGSALADSIGNTGEINSMSIGRSFLSFDGSYLRSNTWFLYRPDAWDHATMADFIAGARPIAAASQDDIRACVDQSAAPDFVRDAIVFKLAARRDRLARFTHWQTVDPVIEVKNRGGTRILSAPDVHIPLTTDADREAAAQRYSQYGVTAELIEQRMREANLLGKRYVDRVLTQGEIQPCHETVLIGLLEDLSFPAHLRDRVNRRKDGKSYKRCSYGEPRNPRRNHGGRR